MPIVRRLKIRQLLQSTILGVHFGIEYEWREVDILAGDTHTPEFLAMNANGKIRLLVLPDGQRVAARPGHIKMQAMAGA